MQLGPRSRYVLNHFVVVFSVVFNDLTALLKDLTRIMAKSKDVSELTHMWQQWHDETGRPLRSKFIRYVELSNEAARLNGKTTCRLV